MTYKEIFDAWWDSTPNDVECSPDTEMDTCSKAVSQVVSETEMVGGVLHPISRSITQLRH